MNTYPYNHNNKCVDCGILISNKATRCSLCRYKNNTGENNPNYRGASICPECGGKKARHAQVCRKCYLKQDKIGENYPNWKGGMCKWASKNIRNTTSFEYAKWRLQIFTRDSFTCQHCQKKSGKLNAHHIQNFSNNRELQLKVDNGITLC